MPILAVIISLLIGNVLIGLLFTPAFERLRKIREQLHSVALPQDEVYARSFRSKPWDAQNLHNAEETTRNSINEIFRNYTLAYQSFRKIETLFLLAILALVNFTIFVAALAYWQKVTTLAGGLALWTVILAHVLATSLILLVARVLATETCPSPERLGNLDYLVSHFSNIHPESLIRLLNICVQKIASEGRSQLALSCGVHLTGYKFFAVISNEDESQQHFIAYGKVSARTKVNLVILPGYYRWNVPVGDLDLQWPQGLDLPVWVHLYVFIPTPVGWKDDRASPYFVSYELWTPHPGDPTQAGENHLLQFCDPRSRDVRVKFRRKKNKFLESWEIGPIDIDADKYHFRLRKLLWFYRRELENATDITTLSGPRLPPTLS